MAAFEFPASPAVGDTYSEGPGKPVYQCIVANPPSGNVWTNIGMSSGGVPVDVTLTDGQTVIPVSYQVGQIEVFRSGARLVSGNDFTADNGTSITLALAGTAGERVIAIPTRVLSALSRERRLVSVKSANYTAALSDIGNIIANTGSAAWTLALPAAALVGNGFHFTVRNVLGGAKVTVDPNGSETVNGLLSFGIYGGDTVDLVCDGTAWHALFQGDSSIVATEVLASARATVDLALPPEFKSFDLRINGFEPTGGSGSLALRTSIDGLTFNSTSGNYFWQHGYDNGGAGNSAIYNSGGTTVLGSTAIELTSGVQSAQAGIFSFADIEITPRGRSRYPGITFAGGFGGYANRGQGHYGASTADLAAVRLLYSSSRLIGAGASYTLVGKR